MQNQNPWGTRTVRRFLTFTAFFFVTIIITGIMNNMFLVFLPLMSVVYFPVYFKVMEQRGKKKCAEVIRSNFSENPVFTLEAWHPDTGWGFLSLTKDSIIFMPKKGAFFHKRLIDITYYATEFVGTGEYLTTTNRVPNTNMLLSGTREAKVPVFYVDSDGERTYWQVRKNNKFFGKFEKMLGVDRKSVKANF